MQLRNRNVKLTSANMNSYRLLSTIVSMRQRIVFCACLLFRRWASIKLHFLPLNCLVGPTLEKQMKPCVNEDPRTRLIPHVLRCNNYSPVNVAERLQTKRGHDTHPSSQLIILRSFCGVWPSHSLKEDQNLLISKMTSVVLRVRQTGVGQNSLQNN